MSDRNDDKNPSGETGAEKSLPTLRTNRVGTWDTEPAGIEQGFLRLFGFDAVPLDMLPIRLIPIKQSTSSSSSAP